MHNALGWIVVGMNDFNNDENSFIHENEFYIKLKDEKLSVKQGVNAY